MARQWRNCSARGGIVLHGGDESCWLDEKIIAVPWWRVM
jgi:hypothetical protein